jgi:uncharacterized DUF497 family protein
MFSQFEFDITKSLTNKEKHGVDFLEAQEIWEDIDRLVIPVRNIDEPRFHVIGKINEKFWSCIYTMRDEKIRIISVRKARKEGISIYEDERF